MRIHCLTHFSFCKQQVGVGIIYLEYRRNERNAEEKKRKEEAYRRQLDEGVHRDREVGPRIRTRTRTGRHCCTCS